MASVADLRKLVAACDAADAATLNAVANAAKEGGLAAEPHLVPALSGILKACAHKLCRLTRLSPVHTRFYHCRSFVFPSGLRQCASSLAPKSHMTDSTSTFCGRGARRARAPAGTCVTDRVGVIMLLILALMLGAWTARCRAYKSQLALKATWASSRPLLPPLYATACPGGSQHVPQGCLAVQRACLDQGTVVLAGDERFIPTPDRDAQPLPQYRPSRAFHFPFPGAASNPDALASPAGLERLPPLAFRPLSAWEPTPDLQRPQWSCVVPIIFHSAWLYNYGHSLGNAASWLYQNVQLAPSNFSGNSRLVVNTPLGLGLPPWSRPLFQPFVSHSVTTLAEFSSRAGLRCPAAGGCRKQRCFERVLLCKGNPPEKATHIWRAAQHIVEAHRRQWAPLVANLSSADASGSRGGLPACWRAPASAGARVWRVLFHRRSSDVRQFTNLGELLARCSQWRWRDKASGLEHHACCGSWTFSDVPSSIAVSQTADVMISAHGANAANAFFMRPGSSLIEVLNPGWHSHLHKNWNAADPDSQLHYYSILVKDPSVYSPGETERRQKAAGVRVYQGDWAAASRDRNVRLEWQSIQQMLVLIVRVNGSTDGYLQLAATGRVEAVVPPSSLIARLSGWWERLNWLWLYS